MAAMMAAVAVAAGVVGFELTVWWEAKAVVPGAFSSDDGEKVVWDWLIQEHVVSKEALIGLAMGMLPPDWPLCAQARSLMGNYPSNYRLHGNDRHALHGGK